MELLRQSGQNHGIAEEKLGFAWALTAKKHIATEKQFLALQRLSNAVRGNGKAMRCSEMAKQSVALQRRNMVGDALHWNCFARLGNGVASPRLGSARIALAWVC